VLRRPLKGSEISDLSVSGNSVQAGWVIAGNTTKTLLIRADGPSLAAFGLAGVLPDPQLAIVAGPTAVRPAVTWSGGAAAAAQISAVAVQVGAFPLGAGSTDAAVLVTLQPGVYTIAVTSGHNLTGAVLIEIYDTQ